MSGALRDHDRWADSVASWLLGALPDEEVASFQAHLEQCPVCQEEVDALLPAVDALPASAIPVVPRPELKDRIVSVVEREAALLSAAGEGADRPAPAPERRRRGWLAGLGLGLRPALALPAVLFLLVLGGAAGLLAHDSLTGDDVRTVQAKVDQKVAGATAKARLEIAGNGAVLVADGLEAPPAGRVYQVWLDKGGAAPEPTSALFSTRSDGSASVGVPGSLRGVRQVMVTDEPAGGSASPTGKLVLTAATA